MYTKRFLYIYQESPVFITKKPYRSPKRSVYKCDTFTRHLHRRTASEVCNAHEWVTSLTRKKHITHTWTSHVTGLNESFFLHRHTASESKPPYEWSRYECESRPSVAAALFELSLPACTAITAATRYTDICIHVYMYVNQYMCTHVYIYAYIHNCANICVGMYVCIHSCQWRSCEVRLSSYMYLNIRIITRIRTWIVCVNFNVYICIYVVNFNVYICTYVYICLYIYKYICMNIYICIYIYIYICTYIFIYVKCIYTQK